MNIVFCADRRVLPGLHVAMYSLLKRMSSTVELTRFYVFSEEFDEADIVLLRNTLANTGKPFVLELRHVEATAFASFPSLNNSLATYYRLLVPQVLDVERFLYVDADTLSDVDVSRLQDIDMDGMAVGWVPEAPLAHAADRKVAEELGNSATEPYFNAGVMLVDVSEWQRQKLTENAIEYISRRRPAFHDQSALNRILYQKSLLLDTRYNCIGNMRKNWPALKQSYGQIGCLVHFLDYPKPWDWLGELVHPQNLLWRAVLKETAMKDFRSWHKSPARRFPNTPKTRAGYKKAIKDRFLYVGYSKGWFNNVKGVDLKDNYSDLL